MGDDTEQFRRHQDNIIVHERIAKIDVSIARIVSDIESEKLTRAQRNAGLDARFDRVQNDINEIKIKLAATQAVDTAKRGWMGTIGGMVGGILTALLTALVMWWIRRVTPMK